MKRYDWASRAMCALLAFPAVGAIWLSPLAVQVAIAAPVANTNARQEVAAALYAASATQAAEARLMDAKLSAAKTQIAKLKAQGESARLQLISAQEAYVADLAARDRAFAQEIAVFRTAVSDIAATPEGVAAMARYNAGDEAGALIVLDRLVDADAKARQTRENIVTAQKRRRNATLALDARNRGKVSTADVIARYEEVTRLDPGLHWDWVELGRLYRDAGNLPQARRAAERAAETAITDWNRGIALEMETDISIDQGDLRSALRAAEASLELRRRIAVSNESGAMRNVSVSLERIGDILVAQGDLAGARARYEEELAISTRIRDADPSNADLQRFVSVVFVKIGDVLVKQGDLAGARARFQDSLTLRQTLAAADPSSASLKRDLIVSNVKFQEITKDTAYARKALEIALEMESRGQLAPADAWMITELEKRAKP